MGLVKSKWFLCAMLLLGLSRPAQSLPERVLAVDFGIGSPTLSTLRGFVYAFPKMQLGFGYGAIPFLPPLPFRPPPQTIRLADGNLYTFTPRMQISFDVPQFIYRYFPTQRNFYLELNTAILRLVIPYVSDLTETVSGITIPDTLMGTITLYQFLPTVSIGHIFSGKAFFFNASLGFTFFAMTYGTATLTLLNPQNFGGSAANATFLELINSNLQSNLASAAAPYKSLYFCLPSITLTFGIYL